MAQKLTLLSVLWIAVAIVVSGARTVTAAEPAPPAEPPTTTGPPNTSELPTSPGTEVTQTYYTEIEPSATGAPPTTDRPDACSSSPCGDGSTCENIGLESFRCLCLAGDSYSVEAQTCLKAKVFPGQLNVPGIPYTKDMSDITTEDFIKTAEQITRELNNTFNTNVNYTGSTVLEITKAALRKDTVSASVQITFKANSEVTSAYVATEMKAVSKCDDCILKGSGFEAKNLCDEHPCDQRTTNCKSSDGSFTCSCKDGYVTTTYSDRICIEACPSGEVLVDSECKKCSFGYSGFNCKDKWQLLLVIVGSVLGGLLLISLILLPVVALKSSKKSSKKNKDVDIGKPYVSHSSAKAPLVNGNSANTQAPSQNGSANAFANPGVPRIPRATTNSAWESRTNLEMTPSHSRQNLVPEGRNFRSYDDDDLNTYAPSRQSSQYAQRPQSNPYGQNRAQFNPYAQSQGHSNPYFSEDSGRRLH